MKDLLKDLIKTSLVSLVAIPLTIVGLGLGGCLWEKVERKIKNKK